MNKNHNIRSMRISVGLSQAKLARLLNMSQATLSQWELGKSEPSSHELNKIFELIATINPTNISVIKKKRIQHQMGIGTKGNFVDTPNISEKLTTNSFYKYTTPMLKSDPPKAISLFSGCGGFSLGVKAAGFSIEGFVELEEDYREIYKENFHDSKELGSDITAISDEEIKQWKKKFGHISLVYGGPPCQGFSLTGKRDVHDPRNTLFQHFVRVVSIIKPDAAIMENVRLMATMKTNDGLDVGTEVKKAFNDIGYSVAYQALNAQDYGVPQSRERVFFIAIKGINREQEISFPLPTHVYNIDLFSNNIKRPISFREATADLEELESGELSKKDPWHFAVNHPPHVIEWLRDVPEGRSAHDNEDPLKRPPSGYNTTYKRIKFDEPCSTISTTFGMISGSRNVHPKNTRSLTIREALRCQSFPDNFILKGSLGSIRTTIGNAVPPNLAKSIAEHIRENILKVF